MTETLVETLVDCRERLQCPVLACMGHKKVSLLFRLVTFLCYAAAFQKVNNTKFY